MAKEKGVRKFEDTIIDYTPEKVPNSTIVLAIGNKVKYNNVRNIVTKVRRVWMEVANIETGEKRWTKKGNLELIPLETPAEDITEEQLEDAAV